jgi:putative membrane protein
MMMGFEIILLVFVGTIALLVVGAIAFVLGIRPQLNKNRPLQTGQTPIEVLKARYARGEITREDYDQMRQDVEG